MATNIIQFPLTPDARLRIEARYCRNERMFDRWCARLAMAERRRQISPDQYHTLLAWGCLNFETRRAAQ